ncbi:HepT-like ribonuclease domain-containing protein [Halomonas sp. E14]|uniref:HepT-like ribonuclease domain-containing protein n=1 Tax=Halomonas sp. E14 TaxID=3397245 RepID=UPI00403E45BF
MSDSRLKREWRFYIDDMIGFAEKVLSYTEGLDQDSFTVHDLTYDATLRNLELIGEAATHIPLTVRQQYPDIPWRMIIATRNRLIHAYLGIDDDTVWSIIQDNIPELLEQLREVKGSKEAE